MKAILDTSVLIATEVPPLAGDLAISTAALAELHFGVL
ncbi:MAG: VapC toxin family PIN domain ribonuclease, partial [Acidimicrobiales bacterium]